MPKKIGITIYQRGHYWYYYLRYNGKTHRGSTDQKNEKEARAAAVRIQYDIIKQTDIKESGNVSLEEFFAGYIEGLKRDLKRPETIKTYSAYIKNLRLFIMTKYPNIRLLKELEKEHIDNFKSFMLARNSSYCTIRNHIKGIKTMYNWAEKNASPPLLKKEHNFMEEYKNYTKTKAKETSKAIEFLNDQEQQRLLSFAKSEFPSLYPIYATILGAGLREREFLSLEWDNIDFIEGSIHVKYKDGFIPKTGERTIPIHKNLLGLLGSLQRKSNYVFVDEHGKPYFCVRPDGKLYKSHKPYRVLQKIACKIGKPNLTRLHELRHTYASTVTREHGIALAQVLLGHKDIRETMRYVHFDKSYVAQKIQGSKLFQKMIL